jgi:HrpA-like RNA helicase
MQSNKVPPQQKLPIFKYKDEIIQRIATESAIVISGLTGCGKSTQVPQYLLDAYPQANIAVCEPRRLAATSLALRVCE